jgi:hypothetical protein
MGKVVGCVLPILILGLIAYLLAAYAPNVLFYICITGYLLVSLVYYFTGYRQTQVITADRSDTERLAKRASLDTRRRTFWGRLEVFLHGVAQHLQIVSQSLTWLFAVPVSTLVLVLFWKQAITRNRAGMLKAAAFPSEIVAGVSALLATGAVFALVYLGADRKIVLFFSVITALAVFIRLISFTIGPVSLPKALRLKSDVPYLIFIMLALLDGVALLFNLHVLRSMATPGVTLLSMDSFLQTGSAVFNTPSFIKMVLPPRPIGWDSLVLGIAGITFFAAVLNNLVRIRQFRRTDEDYVLLATIENQIGAFSKALRLLQKVQDQREVQAFPARATALGGLQQFPPALEEAKAFLTLDKTMKLESVPTLPMFMLASLIGFSGADCKSKVEFVAYAENSGLNSREVAFILEVILSSAGEDSPSIASQLLARQIFDRHPPAKAIALFCSGQREQAIDVLTAGVYNHPIDELYRRQSLLMVQLSDPDTTGSQDSETFARWITENFADLERTVQTSDELSDAFPLVGILRGVVRLADMFQHPDVERLRYLRDMQHKKLRAALPANSDISSFLGAIEEEDAQS